MLSNHRPFSWRCAALSALRPKKSSLHIVKHNHINELNHPTSTVPHSQKQPAPRTPPPHHVRTSILFPLRPARPPEHPSPHPLRTARRTRLLRRLPGRCPKHYRCRARQLLPQPHRRRRKSRTAARRSAGATETVRPARSAGRVCGSAARKRKRSHAHARRHHLRRLRVAGGTAAAALRRHFQSGTELQHPKGARALGRFAAATVRHPVAHPENGLHRRAV